MASAAERKRLGSLQDGWSCQTASTVERRLLMASMMGMGTARYPPGWMERLEGLYDGGTCFDGLHDRGMGTARWPPQGRGTMGRTLEFASRMEEHCMVDGLCCGEETFRQPPEWR